MSANKRKRPEVETAEVDLAPLIDVTFLLMVFFMSIWQAAHIEVAAKLSLPFASQGNPELQQDVDRLIVNVDNKGDFYVANAKLTEKELAALLKHEADRERDDDGWAKRPLFVRADADLPFERVKTVMQMCNGLRIWRLSLRTTKGTGEKENTPGQEQAQ